ncbi:Pycsar system effector family protein [Rheinheimera aquimaris]|uniref:Pycsar system effector family protein n=1 Tax=Rheinheimera aquimaris TaxID=412437 RepID=UPI001E60D894|nr:Pycsar system effector family protein [Rheinheimera aquimaris]MCD1598193.1 DUF5706 domain-containing protein [Rheinheimera aquimaris]
MEERLIAIFELVNTWLKHAEAKAATLLAIDGAVVFGLCRLLQGADTANLFFQIYVVTAVIFLSISVFIALLSFVPALKMPWAFKLNNPTADDNLWYFEHIAKYTPERYLRELSASNDSTSYKGTVYELMLAKQIIINSVICRRKYGLFTFAIWLTLAGVATPIVAAVVWKFGK